MAKKHSLTFKAQPYCGAGTYREIYMWVVGRGIGNITMRDTTWKQLKRIAQKSNGRIVAEEEK